MSQTALNYARALWEALRETESSEERSQITKRFIALVKKRGVEHLVPAMIEHIERYAEREQHDDMEVRTADEDPELIAGAAVYKNGYLVDNTLKSRFDRLTQAFQ